jgi:aminopeptidase N
MKRIALITVLGFSLTAAFAQGTTKAEPPKFYQPASERINDLVHTKLDARFDYSKSQMKGKAWITLRPHFYATDSLLLDAKGMDIRTVAIVKGGKNTNLKYAYDGMRLNIRLDRTYRGTESYTIYIDYTARPDELEVEGSAAITDAKGLYFINPRGEEKDKPTQIWTQGETEATSVWVPTIDRPNQKTTEEIIMTVPAKYVTLSNGLLVSQVKNADGTRTDHWKMDQPHAPYLFFMGVGEFAVIRDKYKNKEVSYYVEKEYAPVARRIFGLTPEMIAFYSRITGVDYPWAKYAQIVGRDYVSGAMENTTATLHQESAQQDARELTDGNSWEDVIAHELFHQWFGDYVTAESWSNLTLNESFANYSETLWNEYKYGKDAGAAHNYSDMQGYLLSGSDKKDLVRFLYNNKEDMFDAVSYNKGGRILHMLRNFVGDSAFFKSLNLYLTTNKYKSAEAQNLRLAFEDVTGKDLNWFWNQWYYGSGHPKLEFTNTYDEASKQVTVIVKQTQTTDKLFRLPMAIDVYQGPNKTRYQVWSENKADTFVFVSTVRPSLVNVDADKILLAVKSETKSLDEYIHQYKYAGNYMDRREAIDAAARKQEESRAVEILTMGLSDKYDGLRAYAVSRLDMRKEPLKAAVESELANLAQKDPSRKVKAAALAKLGDYRNAKYIPLFRAAAGDSSYTVSGNALEALGKADSVAAYTEAKRLSQTTMKGKLASVVTQTLIKFGDESSAGQILTNFEKMPINQQKFEAIKPLIDFLARTKSMETFKRGVDAIWSFVGEVPESFRGQVQTFVEGLLKDVQKNKAAAGEQAMADYINTKLSAKGF